DAGNSVSFGAARRGVRHTWVPIRAASLEICRADGTMRSGCGSPDRRIDRPINRAVICAREQLEFRLMDRPIDRMVRGGVFWPHPHFGSGEGDPVTDSRLQPRDGLRWILSSSGAGLDSKGESKSA